MKLEKGVDYHCISILEYVKIEKDLDYEEIIIPPESPEAHRVKPDALGYNEGYICFFYKIFGCFAKRVCIDSHYYHILFNRYVYTVDGKICEGLYNPKLPNKIDWFYDLEEYDPDYIYCVPCLMYRIVFYNSY